MDMAWQMVEAVLDQAPDLPARPLRVLVCLAAAASADTRQSSPGIDKISRQAHCPRRTAQRALRVLEALGLVKVIAEAAPGRARIYLVLLDPVTGDAQDDTRSGDTQMTPVEGLTGDTVNGTRGGLTGDTLDDTRSGDRRVTPRARPMGDTQDDTPTNTGTTEGRPRPPAPARPAARAQPPPDREDADWWRRGPGARQERPGRPEPPYRGPTRPVPPRSPTDPEVTARGARRARELLGYADPHADPEPEDADEGQPAADTPEAQADEMPDW